MLLWGAAYEAGADGTVGGLIVPAIMGSPPHLAHHLVFLVGLAFWQFIPLYSSIVLAPAWVTIYAACLLVVLVVMGTAGAASGHAAPR